MTADKVGNVSTVQIYYGRKHSTNTTARQLLLRPGV